MIDLLSAIAGAIFGFIGGFIYALMTDPKDDDFYP